MKPLIITLIVIVLGLTLIGLSGCESAFGAKDVVVDTGVGTDAETTEVTIPPDIPPETVFYGMLIDLTSSLPEELGIDLISGTIDAITIPDLPEDIEEGMPESGRKRFYISFIDANPLQDSTLPSSMYADDWLIPAVYPALPPIPDLTDINITYEKYDGWITKEETYRAQYLKRIDAVNAMKKDLADIDLIAIRETAKASGIPASFDKLIRTMAAGEGSEARIIFVSDLDTNNHIEIASPTVMNGSVIGVIAGYGTAETDVAIEDFNSFIEPYGLGKVIPYRSEAVADAIKAWLTV